MSDSALMTVKEVQDYLGVSKKQVMKFKDEFGLPHIQRKENCRIFFPKQQVDEWIQRKSKEQFMYEASKQNASKNTQQISGYDVLGVDEAA